MNLKEFFDSAENGMLTYDQLVSAMSDKKSKFVDLTEGNYVDKQKYTDELASRDTRISSLDEALKARDNDLAGLQAKLSAAGTDSEALAKINKDFADLQKQYDKDTKALEKQMRDQNYKHAVMDFANGQKFTSQAAKRDFVNSMLSKSLQMENDTIIGATDFVTAYTKDNADAFVVETPPENTPDSSKPHFVDSTNPQGGTTPEDPNAFHFDFVGVRPHDK